MTDALSELVPGCLLVSMITVHVVGYGLLLMRAARFDHDDILIKVAVGGGAGSTALGFENWALGYLNGWNQLAFCISSALLFALCLIILLPQRQGILKELRSVRWREWIGPRLLPIGLASCIMLATLLSCLRASSNTDEIDYHWPSPLLWASDHHWEPSPYRFMNGPVLIELLYLPSALFKNMVAGHMTHFLLWILMLFSCSSLGRLLGASAWLVIFAVMSCPTLTIEAPQMLSDLGASAFLVSSLAALLLSRTSPFPFRQILLSSFIFCGGLSAKQPFAVAILPIMVAYLVFGGQANNALGRTKRVALFLLPCIVVELCWMSHTYCLIGSFFDIPVSAIWNTKRAYAMATPPTIQSCLLLPFTPFITSIFGNQEPYGGRTGLVIPVFLPVFFVMMRRFDGLTRHYARWLVGASCFYFFAVGLFVLRTRYHSFVWAIWSTLSGVGFWYLYVASAGKKRKLVCVLFCVLVAAGCLDSLRSVLNWNPNGGVHYIPHFQWFL